MRLFPLKLVFIWLRPSRLKLHIWWLGRCRCALRDRYRNTCHHSRRCGVPGLCRHSGRARHYLARAEDVLDFRPFEFLFFEFVSSCVKMFVDFSRMFTYRALPTKTKLKQTSHDFFFYTKRIDKLSVKKHMTFLSFCFRSGMW